MFLWPVATALVLLAEPSSPSRVDGLGSSSEQRQRFAQEAAAAYRFRLTPGLNGATRLVALEREPLLRWNNQVVREDDGMLFLWTAGNKGRPVAAAQFFLVERQWHHEFQSIADGPFEARNGEWVWKPSKAGLEWKSAGKLAGDSAAQRLRHIKSWIGQFTAAVDPDEAFERPEQLRLLTTPVYRYTSPESGIVEGEVFAFVQGTNPEILLLVEACADGTWRYGFARMSCFYLRVYRDGQIVWRAEREPVPTPDPASTYFFRLSAQVDGSGEVATEE
jgi:hypothetical protein